MKGAAVQEWLNNKQRYVGYDLCYDALLLYLVRVDSANWKRWEVKHYIPLRDLNRIVTWRSVIASKLRQMRRALREAQNA